MSARLLTTIVIDCDRCEEVFSDVVPMSESVMMKLAREAGWSYNRFENVHMCPKCIKATKEAAKTSQVIA